MNKREKVIIIATIIAGIYGAVDLTLRGHPKKPPVVGAPNRTESQVNPELLTAQLGTFASADTQKIDRLTALINEPWPEKVFALRPVPLATEKKVAETTDANMLKLRDQANQLLYSGFLAMGTDRIAIINDMDYRVGEQINGFTITKISQKEVQVSQHDATFDVLATTEQAPAASVDQIGTPENNQPKASP